MKREILFRGFCPDENGTQIAVVNGKEYKGDWVEGFYFNMHHNDKRLHIHHFIIPNNTPIPKERPIGEIQVEVIPETVCEWTGLTDKNGKKIFEGDIVDFEYDFAGLSRGFIIWNEDEARFEIDDDGCSAQFYETRQMEIIGTIFDKEEV